MKTLSLIFLSLFLVSLVSASGLEIVGNNTFDLTKQEGINQNIQVKIQNTDSFTFYNITLDSDIGTMPRIDKLESGQSVNVSIVLNKDQDFDGKLNIIGEYEASLGASNKTELIEVDYENGLSRCDLTLIKGDSINWKNIGLDEIKLKDVNSNEYFMTLSEDENETRVFSEPIVLEYIGIWIVPFTDICTIEVLDDEGFIHSSEYDAEINLKLQVEYDKTSIETDFFSTSYSLDYNQEKTGEYFTIKNNGNKTARDITLSSDWIQFSENNFDLAVGEYRNIEYSVKPVVIETNETNKTYIKTVKIEGNFDTIQENISVYIKYANIDNIVGSGEVNYDLILSTFELACLIYEETGDTRFKSYCDNSNSLYNGSLGSGLEFTPESSVLLLEKMGDEFIKNEQLRKLVVELATNQSQENEEFRNNISKMGDELKENNKISGMIGKISLVSVGMFFAIIVIFILSFLVYKEWQKIKVEENMGYTESELT